MKLHNEHKESIYYHPVTMMCYRKVGDLFEFMRCKSYWGTSSWEKSGMKTGFILI